MPCIHTMRVKGSGILHIRTVLLHVVQCISVGYHIKQPDPAVQRGVGSMLVGWHAKGAVERSRVGGVYWPRSVTKIRGVSVVVSLGLRAGCFNSHE